MIIGNSQVLQRFELCALTPVALVQSVIGKLGSHKLHGAAKKIKDH